MRASTQCAPATKPQATQLKQACWALASNCSQPTATVSHPLTSIVIPDGRLGSVNESGVRAQLLQEYGIEIGGGLGPVAGRVWRIGTMGHTARQRNVTSLIAALTDILD